MADQMQPTPRGFISGLFSDLVNLPLQYMSSPERTQQSQGVAQFLYGTGIPKTLERISYGDSLFSGAGGLGGTTRMRPETAEALLNVAPFAPVAGRVAGRMIKATEGLPVGMSIKPINLNKGIYKPELTMEEMLKVKDIPTVDRVKQSIDLVGEKEFERMVNAQYNKYKPSDVDQEAMLVESVTLDILGKAQRSPYPQQAALDLAQQRAALPVSEGGLGLPANNTPMDRARAMAGLTKENAMSQAHNIGELEFLSIPNQQFKGKLLYQSPSYSGKKGSVYKLGTLNDEPAYLRQSDHFGGFATNLIEGSPEFKAIEEIQKLETGDIFGRVGKTINEWNLKGGKAELKSQEIENALQEYRNSKTDSNPLGSDKLLDKYLKLKKTGKETGAIPLSELIGRLPEKKYSVVSETGERFEVPMIRMPDGSFRSRFAAFDPFRKDVATATAMGVALPDLLAQPVNQYQPTYETIPMYTDPFGNTIGSSIR